MAISRYKNFRTVRSFIGDPRRLETFPAISLNSLSIIPHTIITYKEYDRLDSLAEKFLGDGRYWWAICLLNDFTFPFGQQVAAGTILRVPSSIDVFVDTIQKKLVK